jgi:DNA-directed RNA polymerase specialized sigma24 family protein
LLREILLDRVRTETIRTPHRHPGSHPEPSSEATVAELGPSALEELVGREALQTYEAVLRQLPAREQETVMLNVERGYTHAEVAEAIGSLTRGAARALAKRAILRMAEVMEHGAER